MQKLIPHCSPECIDIIEKLLAYDPDDRLSARQAVKHAFFKTLRAQEAKEKEKHASMSAKAMGEGGDEEDGGRAAHAPSGAESAHATSKKASKAAASDGGDGGGPSGSGSMLPSIDKSHVRDKSHEHKKSKELGGASADVPERSLEGHDAPQGLLPPALGPSGGHGEHEEPEHTGVLPPIGGFGAARSREKPDEARAPRAPGARCTAQATRCVVRVCASCRCRDGAGRPRPKPQDRFEVADGVGRQGPPAAPHAMLRPQCVPCGVHHSGCASCVLQVPGAHGHGKKAGLSKFGPSGKAKLGQTGGASSSRDVVAAHNRTVGGGGALPEGLSFGVGNVGSCSAMHESELSMSGVKAGTLSSGYGLPASGASKNNTYKSYQSPYGTGKRTTGKSKF